MPFGSLNLPDFRGSTHSELLNPIIMSKRFALFLLCGLLAVCVVAQSADNCPRMRAELSASGVQPCSTAVIRAFYRNDGTLTAPNAVLTVTLGPSLTFQSATPAPSSVGGGQVKFALGDVSPGGAWQSVEIRAKVYCGLPVGTQVCATAEVSPTDFCLQAPGWSGAIISASGFCNGGQGVFVLENIGTAPSSTLEYTIIEDQIVLRQGTFQLGIGGTKNDTVPATGKPLTIIAQQEPGYPGDTSVTYSIFNCGGTAEKTVGFSGEAGPFAHQECFEVLAVETSNQKRALPPGFGGSHLVHPGTPIEYRLDFQNVSPDTVQRVVLRDTLDPRFNFEKIDLRGSSHAYTFEQIADSVLQFTFEDIRLPGEVANPAASRGFVEFRAYPKDNLPLGTTVRNRATIQFDQKPPFRTNTVPRKYDRFITLKINDLPGQQRLLVKIYPNPFVGEATFELPENAPPGMYQLDLFDLSGRRLRSQDFDGLRCLLRREDLPPGVFAWRISERGRVVVSGAVACETVRR